MRRDPSRTTILASGAGTNARNVLDRVRDGALPLRVVAVIANDPRAGALAAAREHGVAAHAVVWDRANESRSTYDERLIEAVSATEPELVLLLGWMHVLPATFMQRFPETVNLHPALLPTDPRDDVVLAPDGTLIPALRGAHALRDALRDGVRWVGATVHRVTADTDRGEVLARLPLAVGDATSEEALRDRVRPVEFAAVEQALRRWCGER